MNYMQDRSGFVCTQPVSNGDAVAHLYVTLAVTNAWPWDFKI